MSPIRSVGNSDIADSLKASRSSNGIIFLEELPRPFFVLAPMDDVTDTVFRQIVADTAKPDLFFTEFVNVDGLQSAGRERLLHKLKLTDKEKPVIAQLWGLKPENFYKTTKDIIEMGYSGVDLNMGCPVKTVIKNGACAALINNRELAGEIIDATKEAAGDSLPVSVKTRVGFTTVDMTWIEFLLSKILNMLSIHGRTAKQMSKVPADWDLIGQAVELRNAMFPLRQRPLHADGVQGAGEQQTEVYGLYSEGEAQPVTPQSAASASGAASSAGRQAGAVQRPLIVGNGDVASRAQAEALAEKYNLDGIMIGRGIFHDPFLFAKDSPWEQWSKQQKLDLFAKHIELYLKTYKDGERRFEALRKFCKVYINGFDGASDLRAKFMETSTPEQALDLLR